MTYRTRDLEAMEVQYETRYEAYRELYLEALDEALAQRQAEADAATRVSDVGGTEEYPW